MALEEQQIVLDKMAQVDYTLNTQAFSNAAKNNVNLLEKVKKIGGFSKYKTEWVANSLNKEFWKEVLVGRQITRIKFNKKGLTALVLDNKEVCYIKDGSNFYIISEKQDEQTHD